MATTKTRGEPLELFDRALKGATNDEALEMAYLMLEGLAERAQNAADIGIDADDRDVENEALVFAAAVDDLVNSFAKAKRLKEVGAKVWDAKHDLEKAAANRRAQLGDRWSAVESFSHRRNTRVRTAQAVAWEREKRQSDELVERADITTARVVEALRKVAGETGEARAVDVALVMLPALADSKLAGRQKVINRVSQVLRRLAVAGELRQNRPEENDDGRKTCRYALAGGGRVID